ncbi:uvrD-like Helicase, ATP-binding domain, P-loop containing nucleoside triphosphate hydrolase [Artemisia annua]|uniref:UvrD-like Helicase, ATP-binding domain, P-loop containing nucleoside triphosphate hydrolase n=1 Tax=Artemisia annua TaxID=35608 RepID=A0A2U1NWR5_ARTAN|nr:uvrD-like Helicase, ATP-binding domain, P-loop containing nucleoside triphosphate hydrolase [Artemisia annua]
MERDSFAGREGSCLPILTRPRQLKNLVDAWHITYGSSSHGPCPLQERSFEIDRLEKTRGSKFISFHDEGLCSSGSIWIQWNLGVSPVSGLGGVALGSPLRSPDCLSRSVPHAYPRIPKEYFFNKDLKYLIHGNSDPDHRYASSLTKFKAASYLLDNLHEQMRGLYCTTVSKYDDVAALGTLHWPEMRKWFYKWKLASCKSKSTVYHWRNSISEDLISLRKTSLSVKLLDEIILQYSDIANYPTYLVTGRDDPIWKSCIERYWNNGKKGTCVVRELQHALEDTFERKFKFPGHISPHSFMYLLDHLLFFASLSSDIIFTTRSTLVGWLTSFDSTGTLQEIPDDTIRFIVKIVKYIFHNKDNAASWIKKSEVCPTGFPPILTLKLVMILYLVCLQASDCSKELLDLLLDGDNVADMLPNKFVSDLLRRRDGNCLNLNPQVVAEAFLSVEDPLLIASSGDPKKIILKVQAQHGR